MFNPKLKDFLEKDPEKSLLSFAWSCYWRIWLVVTGIYIAIVVLIIVVDSV